MVRLSMPNLGPFNKPVRFIRRQLPPLNFITIHHAYFILTCLISAIIFWGASTPFGSVSFTDSIFLTVSAMTLAGLNTVNLSTLNTFQQFLLFLLIMLGSAIFVSAFVVNVRMRAFEKKFKDVAEMQRHRRGRSRSRSRARSWSIHRRSGESVRDEETGHADEKQQQGSDGSSGRGTDEIKDEARTPFSALDGPADEDRDPTPPARRGGPEMNTSSPTEELVDNPLHHPKEEAPQSPSTLQPQGVKFRGDTRFHQVHNAYQQWQPSVTPSVPQRRRVSTGLFNMQGVGARPPTTLSPIEPGSRLSRFGTFLREGDPAPSVPPVRSAGNISQYFPSVGGWIARNSQFHGLTEKEREKLGGYEYRAVSLLAWLVPVYFVLWQLLGCIGCAAWVAINRPDSARTNGLNPWWVGAFNAVSAFNNSGMSLLDANMTAYQNGYYLVLTMSLLILAGNTCFPLFLRLIVWCMWKIISLPYFSDNPDWEEEARTLRFLLDHPRRCYTNLFPSQHTWWLLFAVIVLNGVDWAAFEVLNIRNEALNSALPTGTRVLDGLFQAFAVRSGGFYIVSIPSLRISLQVLYVVMMYISVYPVVITMRNSNVYEERSLGIYAEDQDDDDDESSTTKPQTERTSDLNAGPGLLARALTLRDHLVAGHAATHKESNARFVQHQLRAQLAHDAWWIVLALFLIMIVENTQFDRDPAVFSVFNFIFELVSAYGCVGISVGVPWAAYSFCGAWHTLSKLILCAVMLRGRHRGLPVAIDKAVTLPGEESERAEEDDGRIRMARTMSRGRGEFV